MKPLCVLFMTLLIPAIAKAQFQIGGVRAIKVGESVYHNAHFELIGRGVRTPSSSLLGVSDRLGWHQIENLMELSREDIALFLPMSFADAKGKYYRCVQIISLDSYGMLIEEVGVGSSKMRQWHLSTEDIPEWMRYRLGLYRDALRQLK